MISKGAELVPASAAPTIPLMAPVPHNQVPYVLGVYRFKTVPRKNKVRNELSNELVRHFGTNLSMGTVLEMLPFTAKSSRMCTEHGLWNQLR